MMSRIIGPLISTLCFTLIFAVSGKTEIYKCKSEDGVITFSDRPCGKSAEVIQENKNLTVDQAIGNGRPYEQPMAYDRIMHSDIISHARKIGKSLVPEEQFDSQKMEVSKKGEYYAWTVYLNYFLPEKTYMKSAFQLIYKGKLENNQILVQLDYLKIKRTDWYTRLPTLKGVEKLKMHAHYGWFVVP